MSSISSSGGEEVTHLKWKPSADARAHAEEEKNI